MAIDLDLHHQPPPPKRSGYVIGVIGAGFIMRDVHLVAYERAGFRVAAIASRNTGNAREVARLRNIPKVHETVEELLRDPELDIVDVAVPPSEQLAILRAATECSRPLKGILAQKPLTLTYDQARTAVQLCRQSGIRLAVNQNMRFDQSIRALHTLLRRGDLGEPVLATIEMRAVPHWKPWAGHHGKLTFLIMSIHHLDCFRYLFGDPESVYASVRTDPRTKFAHHDGICLYILEYSNGFRASGWDDVWAGPDTAGKEFEPYIKWRVEGLEGVAEGSIGWPFYPERRPSQIRFRTARQPGTWFSPSWQEAWFPDAFAGPMGALMDAIAEDREPDNSGDDNLRTMALVEACYRSVAEHRPVAISEIHTGR